MHQREYEIPSVDDFSRAGLTVSWDEFRFLALRSQCENIELWNPGNFPQFMRNGLVTVEGALLGQITSQIGSLATKSSVLTENPDL